MLDVNNTNYPEIFKTEIISDKDERLLIANALEAWGLAEMGIKIPESFGRVMALIAVKLGVSGGPESLKECAIKKGYLKPK